MTLEVAIKIRFCSVPSLTYLARIWSQCFVSVVACRMLCQIVLGFCFIFALTALEGPSIQVLDHVVFKIPMCDSRCKRAQRASISFDKLCFTNSNFRMLKDNTVLFKTAFVICFKFIPKPIYW